MCMNDLTTEEVEKLSEKNSFLIQKSLIVDLKEMGKEETQLLFNSIFDYVNNGVLPELAEQKFRFVRASFNRFKEAYINDSRKWIKQCNAKSKAKSKEWEKRKQKIDENGNPTEHPTYK